jgi:hypothetical protein
MARTGLRMKPTFPSPPLKFRTAGFPPVRLQGWPIEGCLPSVGAQLSRPSGLLPSFALIAFNRYVPLCVGAVVRLGAAIRANRIALPQGSSLRSGLCCPGPSLLTRPHPPQWRAHPDFAAPRLIRDAFAVQVPTVLRRPTTGSKLSLLIFRNMSSSETTGNSPVAFTQYLPGDSNQFFTVIQHFHGFAVQSSISEHYMRKIILMFLLGSALAQSQPQRPVRGQTLVSRQLPAARFTLSKNFHYVGGQVIKLYGNAEAEQHLFVNAQNGLVESFCWLQFEHFLPSNKMRYDYEMERSVKIGDLSFISLSMM